VVVTLTLSKSLGSQGGGVLAVPALIEHLVNTARSFIYDTGLAPAAAGAALAAVEVVRAEPGRGLRALDIAARLSSALKVPAPAGAVLSVPMSGPREALTAQERLRDEGFLVGCFRPPSVPDGVSRLRLTAKADLAEDDVERLLAVLSTLVVTR
jgi:8-amino-7-oxononanoate synthase